MARAALLLLAVLAACAPPQASATPTPAPSAVARASAEAERLLGPGATLVYSDASATLRRVYGGAGGVDRGFDDPGIFAVYRAASDALYAEVFVRYEDLRVSFSRATREPVRR